ncbi:MAG: Arylesterase [Pseudomonadota bacterium]|nr:Arylesterase [Pseudomonadota bacterium]
MTPFAKSVGYLAFSGLLLLFLAGCGQPPKLQPIPPGASVLAFGDSVTFGTGAPAGQDWPTLLAEKTGWQITNAGIPGDTAEQAQHRLPDLLVENRPALVIIEIGGNDFLKRTPQPEVKADIRRIIQAVKGVGAQAVLVAVPEWSLLNLLARKTDAPIYRELGKEEGVLVIEQVFSDVLSQPELCADRIHPNAKGYQVMADGLYDALKKAGAL